MGGYIANFTVYTMAMIGLICFAVFIYKKFMDGTMRSDNTKFLSVEESMSLSPRKTLHVVRAGKEKFLIASDIDRTTLISKLGTQNIEQYNAYNDITQNFEQISKPVEQPIVTKESFKQELSKQETPVKTVHLEPINIQKQKTLRQQGMKMDTRMPNSNSIPNNSVVTLDFDKPINHGFSTMKEMAKKINEL